MSSFEESCFYCGENMKSDNLERHISMCQHVLEPCPFHCGLYVPRNLREKHKRFCMPAEKVPQDVLTKNNSRFCSIINAQSEKIQNLEYQLRKCNEDIQNLKEQIFKQQDFKLKMQNRQEADFKTLKVVKLSADTSAHNVKELIAQIKALKERCFAFESVFQSFQFKLEEKEKQIKSFIAHETDAIKLSLHEQPKQLNNQANTSQKGETEISQSVQEIKKRQGKSERKIQKYEKEIEFLKSSLAQISVNSEMKMNLDEEGFNYTTIMPSGRFIWKISDFQLHLNMSKANEKVPLKSPPFYSKDYGYKIRLLVYLNGLKKWKGLYLLAFMQVLKGDYDNLLKWPCKIKANVTLKDCDYEDQPEDFTRYITAKRECPYESPDDPQESSLEYLFVPHKELLRSKYLKNDAVYLEVVILK